MKPLGAGSEGAGDADEDEGEGEFGGDEGVFEAVVRATGGRRGRCP